MSIINNRTLSLTQLRKSVELNNSSTDKCSIDLQKIFWMIREKNENHVVFRHDRLSKFTILIIIVVITIQSSPNGFLYPCHYFIPKWNKNINNEVNKIILYITIKWLLYNTLCSLVKTSLNYYFYHTPALLNRQYTG